MTQGPNLVLEWLSKLYLADYVESFIDNGYDDLEVCKQIGEPDLDAIGVHIAYHRHRLLTAVQRLKEEDKRKAPGYYFTLEPLDASTWSHATHTNREADFRTQRSHTHTTGIHQPSCPGNHNLRFTDCKDFITYPKLKLKVLIRDKLAKDGINLGDAPYTHKVGSHCYLFKCCLHGISNILLFILETVSNIFNLSFLMIVFLRFDTVCLPRIKSVNFNYFIYQFIFGLIECVFFVRHTVQSNSLQLKCYYNCRWFIASDLYVQTWGWGQ